MHLEHRKCKNCWENWRYQDWKRTGSIRSQCGYMKSRGGGGLLDQMSDYQLLKQDSAENGILRCRVLLKLSSCLCVA
jgi:hypothetical protein